jgi:ABC-type nitrate/sulfonate/bicarbonate transport system permease component
MSRLASVSRYWSGPLALSSALGLWHLLWLTGLPDFVLSPVEVARHFARAVASGELFPHVGASLVRSLPGFALGTALGVGLGLLAGVARGFDQMLSPVVFLTYPVPKIVMLPLFMLWFGIGDVSKILIIALACFYPSFVSAYHGARATPTILVWSARNMGAGRGQTFRKVVVPAALPLVFAGVRVSLALSFILLFSTEMINARTGLGSLIRQAESSLAFDLMYVSIVAIAILGWASDRLLRAIRTRLLAWQEAMAA